MVTDIAAVAEVGKTYLGKVVRIVDFGAFVEIFPGTDGLLHISEISENRIKKVRDELNEGDQILVKVLALEGNKIKLSRKAILKEQRDKLKGWRRRWQWRRCRASSEEAVRGRTVRSSRALGAAPRASAAAAVVAIAGNPGSNRLKLNGRWLWQRPFSFLMNIPASGSLDMMLSCSGEAGRAWLDRLPRVIEELCARWQLRLGEPFEGGCVAYVAPALRADGEQFVLKVSFIDDETRHEADALALWDGDGAVRLIDHDASLGGLLLERLQPGVALHQLPDREEAISIACRLLKRLRRPVPAGHPFALVPDLARQWALELRPRFENSGARFDAALLDHAAALCRELAAWQGEPVLVNRDFHLGNILSAQREPWLLIDPKPLAGEAAFDAGYLLPVGGGRRTRRRRSRAPAGQRTRRRSRARRGMGLRARRRECALGRRHRARSRSRHRLRRVPRSLTQA